MDPTQSTDREQPHRGSTLGPDPDADPASLLAQIEAERERASRALEPDVRVIYGAWGMAWVVGFLLWYAAARDVGPVAVPLWVAGTVFGAGLLAAMVTTMVHIGRRVAGVRGVSSRVGAMYGWAWFLSFGTLFAVMGGASRQGLSEETGALLWSVLSGLVVGALYLAGGALWQDRTQYAIGAWILVASAAGALAGYPNVYLVMALAGGGGFLLAAVFFSVRHRLQR